MISSIFVHLDGDGHRQFLPLQFDGGFLRLAGDEIVGQPFAVLMLVRLDGDAQGVFGLIVEEAAPGVGVLREDDGPFLSAGDHVQAVAPGGQRLAFDQHVVRRR